MNFSKLATKPFTASCGHRIASGETYQVTYNPHRKTECSKCANNG